MDSFKGVSPHRPMSDIDKEIRIINLLPSATFNAPIECKLEHIVLQPGADYEAVSYCWGESWKTESILLDGRPYPVTTTLFDGLKYLRQKTAPRRLWIDSLCINQKDIAERSHEILKMRKIYKLARGVLIWLGDYYPYSRLHVKRIFDHVKRIAAARTNEEEQALVSTEKWDRLWHLHGELQRLIENWKWFQRIWVLQEVSVRPKPYVNNVDVSPTLICGDLSLPYPYLRWVDEYWVLDPGHRCVSLPSLCLAFERLNGIWEVHQELTEEPEGTLAQRCAWVLCRVSATFYSTDPRDMVYAVLGLMGEVQLPPALLPDYNKSTEQVFLDYATFILLGSRLLTILLFNSMKTDGLPTWVPDWRHAGLFLVQWEEEPWEDTHVRILRDIGALEVDVIFLTRINRIGPRFKHKGPQENIGNSWQSFFLDAVESLNGYDESPSGYDTFELALWQLLLSYDLNTYGSYNPRWHAVHIRSLPPFLAWKNPNYYAKNECFYDDVERQCLISLAETTSGKFLFRGRDGHIGMVGQKGVEPQENDIICTIKGAHSDFIVREYRDGYRIVGVCTRTARGDQSTFNDHGLADWAWGYPLMMWYHKFWSSSEGQRALIY
ncbi:HET-domain-containing protein [Poronia punctata]|nr:HET-domain-containing protein [Poronia punctata]